MLLHLVLLAAAQQGQSTKVSIDLPVCPVIQVLEKISQQNGQKFAVSGAVRNDFIFVKVKDVDSQILLNRIAEVVDGKWVKGNGVTTLTAPENFESESDLAYQRNVGLWTTALAKTITKDSDFEKLAATVGDLEEKMKSGSDTAWSEADKLNSQKPIGRLFARLLVSLTPQLGKLKNKRRVVFSTQPTSLQQPLPPEASQIIAEFRSDYAKYRQALASRGLLTHEAGVVYYGNTATQYGNPEPPANFILSTVRSGDTCTVDLKFWDRDGNFAIDENSGMWAVYSDFEKIIEEQNPFKDLKQKVKRPAMADKYKVMELTLIGRPAPNISKYESDAKDLIDIEKNEPLAEIPTDILRQYTDVVKKNVVAYVPDSCIQNFFLFTSMKPEGGPEFATLMPTLFRSTYFGAPKILVQERDGIQTIRDQFLGQARMSRMPRRETASFLKSIFRQKSFNIDAFADYLKQIKYDDCLAIVSLYSSTAAMRKLRFPNAEQLSLLRFYAEYSPPARDQIKRSELRLPISSLNRRQSEILKDMVVDSNTSLYLAGDVDFGPPSSFGVPLNVRHYFGSSNIRQEPTYALAKGMPPGANVALSMKTVKTILVSIENATGPSMPRALPIGTIANDIVYKEKGMNSDYYSRPRKYAIEPSTYLQLNLDLDPLGKVTKSYILDEFPLDIKWLELNELPPDALTEINRKIDEVRTQMRGIDLGSQGNGRNVKPPVKR